MHKLITDPANPAPPPNFLQGSWGFLGHEPPVSLHGLAINLSLLKLRRFSLFGLTVHRAHELVLTEKGSEYQVGAALLYGTFTFFRRGLWMALWTSVISPVTKKKCLVCVSVFACV